MANIDLGDVQGNILRAYNMPVARYSFYHVAHPKEARDTLLALAAEITSADPWPSSCGKTVKPPSTLNLGLNFQGLRALGLPADTLDGFSPAFQAGMQARADKLGDDGESGVENWDEVWRTHKVHVWLSVNAINREQLESRCDSIKERIDQTGGLEFLGDQDAASLGHGKEHFGYTDGIGNPYVAGSPAPSGTRTGKLTPDGGWVPLATGEFLLGYANEGREIAPMPYPLEFSRNGTFMVYRKLRQKVALFRGFLEAEGKKYPGGADLLAAKLVGRWRDGTPLAISPDRRDPAQIKNNRFTYEDDPRGLKCPIGAHIRRANPRGSLGFDGRLVNRHRIIRRGLAYGPLLPEGVTEDQEQDRGIIFLAINANIETQFEFVQQQWMNYGNRFGLGNEQDPLLGGHEGGGRFLIQGDVGQAPGHPPHMCQGLQRFVVTLGGDYFFLPSISGLKLLARGEFDADQRLTGEHEC